MAKVMYRVVGPDGADFRIRDNAGVVELSYDGGSNWLTATELAILDGVTATAAEINTAADTGSRVVSITDATTYACTAANSGKTHVVPELTADIVISLPTAAAGLEYVFIAGANAADAQDWQIDTGSDTNFYIGGVVQHDTDDAGDDTVVYHPDGDSNSKVNFLTPDGGTRVHVACDGTNWFLNAILISATDAGVTWADQ